ncbi:hypothetical protein DM02DRAFT_512445, partial [Periconia macrospinosa]
IPLAIIGAIIFLGITAIYVWLFARYQAWYFWAILAYSVAVECAGFIARVVSVCNTANADLFIISYLTLLLAPSFMAAACYTTFGRLLWWVTPPECHNVRTLWPPTRFVTSLFICFDLGSFLIQLLGAGVVGTVYASKSLTAEDRQERIRAGLDVLKMGFALQLICFSLFVLVSARFL